MTARKGWLIQCDGCGETEFLSGNGLANSSQLDRFLKAAGAVRRKKFIYCGDKCLQTHKQKQQNEGQPDEKTPENS